MPQERKVGEYSTLPIIYLRVVTSHGKWHLSDTAPAQLVHDYGHLLPAGSWAGPLYFSHLFSTPVESLQTRCPKWKARDGGVVAKKIHTVEPNLEVLAAALAMSRCPNISLALTHTQTLIASRPNGR